MRRMATQPFHQCSRFVPTSRAGSLPAPEADHPPPPTEPSTPLTRPGIYAATTAGGESKIDHYEYPTLGDGFYPGPEVVYRVHISKPIANFGVAVLSGNAIPHIVFAGDENHLAGFALLLPARTSTRVREFLGTLAQFSQRSPSWSPGNYDVVFDTRSAAQAGPFKFRFWLNDTTPPTTLWPFPHAGQEGRPSRSSTRRRRRPRVDQRVPRWSQHRPAIPPRAARPQDISGTSPVDRDRLRLPGAEEHGGRGGDRF